MHIILLLNNWWNARLRRCCIACLRVRLRLNSATVVWLHFAYAVNCECAPLLWMNSATFAYVRPRRFFFPAFEKGNRIIMVGVLPFYPARRRAWPKAGPDGNKSEEWFFVLRHKLACMKHPLSTKTDWFAQALYFSHDWQHSGSVVPTFRSSLPLVHKLCTPDHLFTQPNWGVLLLEPRLSRS
jgi:hypothetical protein